MATKYGGSKSSGKAMGGKTNLSSISTNDFFGHCLVTSITFNNEDSETFIFGCDSGLLYKGSLSSESSVQSRKRNFNQSNSQQTDLSP